MAINDRCSCCISKSCCKTFWLQIYGILLRSIPVLIAQLVGWALFSYIEDDLSIIDCFANKTRVIEKTFPSVDETKRVTELFEKLYNKTGQILSNNQSISLYDMFKTHFNVPDAEYLDNNLKVYLGCLKWYRFSVMTMTTIGFGQITPKKTFGKMLVIPYALITMPLMLSLLAYVGALVSEWIEKLMHCVHRIVNGSKPLRYKLIIQFPLLLIILFVTMLSLYTDLATEFKLDGIKPLSLLDGLYFTFVTFTTIGYGDMPEFANGVTFYSFHLIVGLSAVSGLSTILIALAEKFRCRTGSICCCVYVEDELANVTEPDVRNVAEVQA